MSGLDRDDVRGLLSDVSARTGLHFHDRQVDQLRETIERAMRQAGCPSMPAFRRKLQSTIGAFDDLVGALTVGETYFFRDPRQFEFVRDEILPNLLSRPGVRGFPQLWSAGCSSGEEAYSLAILLEEANPAGDGRVLATDISRPALQLAREARYREWSLRGAWRSRAARYLTPDDGLQVLDRRIRGRVKFEYLNLSADLYPSRATETWGLDLIFCRNVLIYMDRDTIARVCRQFLECLAPGGWLVLGASDPDAAEFADFETISAPAGRVYRRPPSEVRTASVAPPADGAAGRLTADQLEPAVPDPSPGDSEPTGSTDAASRPVESRPVGADTLHTARAAMQNGDHALVVALTRERLECEEAGVLHVRALASRSVEEAEQACSTLVRRHRLSMELLYLHAILLMDLGRNSEAVEQLRRVIFLDRSAVIAHFTQGTAFLRLGMADEARRAFRNARRHAAAVPSDEALLLGDGETAGRLLESAHQQLQLLGETETAG